MWKYMGVNIDPRQLPAKDELLKRLYADGSTDRSLSHLREEQYEKFNMELIWRYPISQGESAGGFVIPVREGGLWIPYDEMEKEEGEVLLLSNACLMTADVCHAWAEDFRFYADGLCNVLKEAEAICEGVSAANVHPQPACVD